MAQARGLLAWCRACPVRCGADRVAGGRAPSAAEMCEAFELAGRLGLERLDERAGRQWWL